MPVAINMNMPKNCLDCNLCVHTRGYDDTYETPTCPYLLDDVTMWHDKRHPKCPLKEIK